MPVQGIVAVGFKLALDEAERNRIDFRAEHVNNDIPSGIFWDKAEDFLGDFLVMLRQPLQADLEGTALAHALTDVASHEHELDCQQRILIVGICECVLNVLLRLVPEG